MTTLLLVAIAGLVMLAPQPASAQGTVKKKPVVKCDGASGWGSATGTPVNLVRGGPLGLYVWNQRGVWRVSVTNPEKKLRLFQGSISFDAPVTAKPVGLEGRSDSVVVGNSSVSFTFKNFGQLDGIGIEAPCASTVTVTGTIDGLPLVASQVFLGSGAINPGAIPVFLRKEGTVDPAAASSTGAPAAPTPAPTLGVTPALGVQANPASASVAPPPAAVTNNAPSACSSAPWPTAMAGRPAGLKKLKGRALYAWNDKTGWNFSAAGESGKGQIFEGRVIFNAPVSVKVSELEENDQVWLDPTSTIVSFSLKVGESFDGFVVSPGCATLFTIDVSADGQPLPANQLKLGAGFVPATTMPYVVSR